MEKSSLNLQFAKRLRTAMINAGFGSTRSASGVQINKLAEMTGCSVQICRKYLQGLVIPELSKLSALAEKLHVSPGWLLFGESHSTPQQYENKITISKNLLHYIFTYANQLYNINNSTDTISNFLLDLTHNVSQLNANDEQSKKIVDLAMRSVNHFTPNT